MSIRKIIISGLLVVVAGTVIYWSLRRVDVEPNAGELISLTQTEETMLRTWRGDPEKAKVVGAICLKHSLPKKQIIELIGTPQHRSSDDNINSIGYSCAPSQGLSFYFDEDDNTIHVEGIDDNYPTGIARAWPTLHTGMTRSTITVRLGEAQKELDDGRVWHYIPRNSPTIFIVTFDANDKVEKLETTDGNIK